MKLHTSLLSLPLLVTLGCVSTKPAAPDPSFQVHPYHGHTSLYAVTINDIDYRGHKMRQVELRAKDHNTRPYKVMAIDDNIDGTYETFSITDGYGEESCVATSSRSDCFPYLLTAAQIHIKEGVAAIFPNEVVQFAKK